MTDFFSYLSVTVEELRYNVVLIKELTNEAEDFRKDYREKATELELFLNGEEFSQKIYSDTILEAKELILTIFEDEFERAIDTSREFNFDEFRVSFLNAVYDIPDLVGFSFSTENIIQSTFNLEKLGTLQDYVDGVKYARVILGAESAEREAARMGVPSTSKNPNRKKRAAPKMTPERASIYWKDWVYRGGQGGDLHSKTIALRLQNFASKAPFWHILEDGTPIKLASDWEPRGFPTPETKPTRFVAKAKKRIELLLEKQVKESETKLKLEINEEIERLDTYVSELEDDIALLLRLLEEAENEKIKKARELFNKHLELAKSRGARIEKIEKLFLTLVRGEPVRKSVYLGYTVKKRTIILERKIREILQGS